MYLPKRLEHFYQALSEVIIAFKNADIWSASLYTEQVTSCKSNIYWFFPSMALRTFDNFYTLTRIQKKQLVFLIDEYVPFPKYGEGRFTVVIIWK